MVGERPEPLLQDRGDGAHMADDVALLVDLQGLEGDGGAHRVAGVGVAVPEDADPVARLDQLAVDRLRDQHRAHRQVGRGQGLGHGHHVGPQIEGLGRPVAAGAAEAADHLVDHEQDVVLAEHGLDLLEIGRWGDDHAARAHHRLGDEGRDRVGSLLEDQPLQIVGQTGREVLLGLAGPREAVVVGAVGMEDALDRQVEVLVVGREPGQAGRGDGDAVVGLVPADDLLLVGPAARIVVVPDQLDRGVVGFRAGRGEEGLGHGHRRQLHQLLGEVDALVVAAVEERVEEGEPAHLRGRRLDQALLAEAERGAPQTRQSLDVFVAVLVVDVDAAALGDHQGALLLVQLEVGIGMQEVGDIARPRRVRLVDHGSPPHATPRFRETPGQAPPAAGSHLAERGGDVTAGACAGGARKPPACFDAGQGALPNGSRVRSSGNREKSRSRVSSASTPWATHNGFFHRRNQSVTRCMTDSRNWTNSDSAIGRGGPQS